MITQEMKCGQICHAEEVNQQILMLGEEKKVHLVKGKPKEKW
jgi:hypothetical protein